MASEHFYERYKRLHDLYGQWKTFHIQSLDSVSIESYNNAKDAARAVCEQACCEAGKNITSENVLFYMDTFFRWFSNENRKEEQTPKDYSDPGLHECIWCHTAPTIESFCYDADHPLFFLRHVSKDCPISNNNGCLGSNIYASVQAAADAWNAPFKEPTTETIEWHGIEFEKNDLDE